LDGVGPTKDVFLTSLEMLAGALPIKKDKKKGDPLRHSIDNIKAKTKVEAFTRAELAERKDDLLRYTAGFPFANERCNLISLGSGSLP